MNFKEFLLNEQQAYLAQKVGDILTAVQELQADSAGMGTRDLVRYTQQVINQIRPILHSSWPREERRFLQVLQRVAVSLAKAVEDKGELPAKISGAAQSLEKLVADLGVPINKLNTTEPSSGSKSDSKGTDISASGKAAAKKSDEEGPKTAASAQPQQPSPQESIPQGAPPTPPGQDMYAPSLGGSSGPLDAF